MSLKWPPKDPDEKLDFSVDWSRFLGSDTISNIDWFINDAAGTKTPVTTGVVVNGLTFEGQTNNNTVALCLLSGGTDGTVYVLTCSMTFGISQLVSERKIKLPIRGQ